MAFSVCSWGLEYRSVIDAKAVTFDAPSTQATKIYILNAGYPVEIIVHLGAWVKVRDAMGSLSWIESAQLSPKRTVMVLNKSSIFASEGVDSTVIATVEKDVTLELVSSNIKNGWVKVKHRDGVTGYMQASALWGSN